MVSIQRWVGAVSKKRTKDKANSVVCVCLMQNFKKQQLLCDC